MSARALKAISVAVCLVAQPGTATAGEARDGGKLLLTNGISSVEGPAGGGLTPWAVIAGNETRDGVGLQGALTRVAFKDYDLTVASIAVGLFDRIELSFAHHAFDTNKVGAALGLGREFRFDQNVVGVKARVAGDLVYGSPWMPAIAVGALRKYSQDGAVARAVGARHDSGTDVYVSATKLSLSHSLLINATLRWTSANQLGLLGFGGDRRGGGSLAVEGSAAYQLSRRLAIGGEYRTRPDNLGFAREDDAFDLFAAYAVQRHLTITTAYADLGSVAAVAGQRGLLLQLQGAF